MMDHDSNEDQQEARLRERISATRAHMSETIEQIGSHLDPAHLKQEFKDGMREQVEETKEAARMKVKNMTHQMEDSMNQTGRTLMDTVRENPMPAALVGVGFGWLVAEGRKQQSNGHGRQLPERYGAVRPSPGYLGAYAEGGYAQPAGEIDILTVGVEGESHHESKTERARQKARSAAEDLRGRAEHATDSARETASEMTDEARKRATQAKMRAEQTFHEAEMRARRMEGSLERSMRENPLAAGAAMVAAGFAVGMMIPETDQERELMGDMRERVGERAHEKADQVGGKIKHVAEETARQAKTTAQQAAEQEGLKG